MEPSIFKYILRYSKRQQVILTLMAFGSFPFLYMFYELPKRIVNEAIQGDPGNFPVTYFDVDFSHLEYLFALCGIFLALVLANQSFKYMINVYKGITAERMLRRLRFDLYSRVLRFPLPTFRKMSQGEIIPMITAEVEPLGGFVGDAFALPAFQGGTLIVILSFLFIQSPVMASAAVALYPLQVWLIPKLQRRVNKLAKRRVQMVRKLSERIGETVQGVQEVHAHDTSNLEMADIGGRLGDIFHVRYEIYRKKFVIKFLNNSIQHLGPFFFYSMGGYLVIGGQLDIGTLIAVIAAHKDLAAPWKELLSFYQQKEDARIKYDQVIRQFQPAGMRDAEYQLEGPDRPEPLAGELRASNLRYKDDQDTVTVAGVSLAVGMAERVAVVGEAGSGKHDLILLLARLLDPTGGKVAAGGLDMAPLPEAVTGRRLSYVGPEAFTFSATIGDNLFYSLKHRPLVPPEDSEVEARERAYRRYESEASGNLVADTDADWIDYQAAGVKDNRELVAWGLEILVKVALGDDMFRFGLRGAVDPGQQPELAEAVLGARKRLRERLGEPDIAPLVELFDRAKYNSNATLAENLLFGTPVGDAFDVENLADHPYVQQVLDKAELTETLVDIGAQVAATMVELFADLPPDHEFFQQFSFIEADDLPEFKTILTRVEDAGLAELAEPDRRRLLSLPFRVIPAQHRLGVITEEVQERLLAARALFAADLPADIAGGVEFFDSERYNAAVNLQENILFGKIAFGQAGASEKVGLLVAEVIDELGLRDVVAAVGLEFQCGVAGSRLSAVQRQKLAIARALVKRPDLLLLSEATAALDVSSQATILDSIVGELAAPDRTPPMGVLWSLHQAAAAEKFDRVIVMKEGSVVETGTFEELSAEGTYFRRLLESE